METKRSWWSLTIQDYPNYKPSDADLDHIAEMIKQGYDQGELIQENEDEQKTRRAKFKSFNKSQPLAPGTRPKLQAASRKLQASSRKLDKKVI